MLVSQYFVFIQQFHVISEARLIKLYSYTLLLNENFWDKIYVFLSISVHRTSVRFHFLVYSACALVSYPVIVSFVLPEDMNTLDFFFKKKKVIVDGTEVNTNIVAFTQTHAILPSGFLAELTDMELGKCNHFLI